MINKEILERINKDREFEKKITVALKTYNEIFNDPFENNINSDSEVIIKNPLENSNVNSETTLEEISSKNSNSEENVYPIP